MKLLAGDVGGTKTVLALFEAGAPIRRAVFPSGRFDSLGALIREFLGAATPSSLPAAACLGIAGPVADGQCRATNLPWIVEARCLEAELGIPRVALVNDFHALSVGIAELPPEDFAPLCDVPGDPRGPWAVIGAGTGLGEATLFRNASGALEVCASEGSHADFGPRDDVEIELLRFLRRRHGHVSYERIASGSGLPSLYDFWRDQGLPESPAVRDEMARRPEARPAIISGHALAGDDALCVRALDLFVSVYGAAAGNLALTVLPRGGVYVAGGISPKILPKLKDGAFVKAFRDKGRLGHVLETIPIHVVLNPDAGLVGAAVLAGRLTA